MSKAVLDRQKVVFFENVSFCRPKSAFQADKSATSVVGIKKGGDLNLRLNSYQIFKNLRLLSDIRHPVILGLLGNDLHACGLKSLNDAVFLGIDDA